MTSAMDMALDDVIKSNRRTRRGGATSTRQRSDVTKRTPGGGVSRRGRSSAGTQRAQAVPYGVRGVQPATSMVAARTGTDGSKIVVSNLHFNVTEADLKVRFVFLIEHRMHTPWTARR